MKKKVTILFLLIMTAILTLQTTKLQTYSRYSSTYNETIKLTIEEPHYFIRFNANTGTGTMQDQEFVYGTSQTLTKNAFKKYGYNFTGWNTLANNTGTSYTDEEELLNLTNANDAIIDIYAQYENIINMRITDVGVDSTNNATSSNEEFDFEELTSTISLNSQDAYVVYEIDITNYLDKNMGILSITGLPNNLEYEIVNDYEMKTKLCSANTGDADTESILLKIKYKDNGYNGTTTYNLDLDFEYREVFNITYENIPNGTDLNSQNLVLSNLDNGPTGNYPLNVVNIKYPKEIMVDDTVEFDFYPYIPTTLSVSDTVTSNYTKPSITLSNVTGDVTIKSTTMGEWVMFDHPESVTFDGNNLINTQLQLLSEANFDRDFKVTFTIDSNNTASGTETQPTMFNILRETNPWPGVVVRQQEDASDRVTKYLVSTNGGNPTNVNNYYGVNDIQKVELVKLDDIIYYRLNDGYYIYLTNFTDYDSFFNAPATFGGSLDGNGNEFRYFRGALSNMEIRYLDSDIDPKTYIPMYAAYEYAAQYNFTGSNNLNTGIGLFTEENYDKDFVISVDVDTIGNGNSLQATIINAFYENILTIDGTDHPYPGFAFRIGDDSTDNYYITANNNDRDTSVPIATSNIGTFKFIRENKVLYYQINDGEKVELYDFGDPTLPYYNVYFNTPITFGSSLTSNNEIQRGFIGNLSNMYILLEMDGSGVTPTGPGTGGEDPGTDPENPGTDPENPGTDPEDPGTDPDTGGLDITYKVNGVTIEVTLTNKSTETINNWSVDAYFTNGVSVTESWSSERDDSAFESEGKVTFSAVSYNSTIAPGGTQTFGFNVSNANNLENSLSFKTPPADPGTGGGEDPGTGGEDPGTGGEDPGTGGEEPSSNPVTATATLADSWTGGYRYEVKVTNSSSSSVSSWSITVTLPEGAEIANYYNAELTTDGNNFTFSNLDWNGTLAPDGSVTFGIQINSSTPITNLTFR